MTQQFLSWWNFSSFPTFHSFQVHPLPPLLTSLASQVSVLLLYRITTSSPLQNSSNFSPYRRSGRQLYHQVRWKFYMSNRLVGEAPGARRRWTMALCACCLAAQQLTEQGFIFCRGTATKHTSGTFLSVQVKPRSSSKSVSGVERRV